MKEWKYGVAWMQSAARESEKNARCHEINKKNEVKKKKRKKTEGSKPRSEREIKAKREWEWERLWWNELSNNNPILAIWKHNLMPSHSQSNNMVIRIYLVYSTMKYLRERWEKRAAKKKWTAKRRDKKGAHSKRKSNNNNNKRINEQSEKKTHSGISKWKSKSDAISECNSVYTRTHNLRVESCEW